jgi:uncharacterized protein YgiM (DUF1202 family)
MMRFLCASMLLMVTGMASAAEPYGWGIMMGDDVYVRSGAGKNFRDMCMLKKGAEVKVWDVSADEQWLRIEAPPEGDVYIFARYVSVQGNLGTLTGDKVRIRVRPELTAEVVNQVSKGARLTVKGRQGDWLKIAPPKDSVAWISAKFVKRMTADQYALHKKAQTDAVRREQELKRKAAERLARLKREAEQRKLEAARKQREAAMVAKADKLLKAELAKPVQKRSLSAALAAWRQVQGGVKDSALRSKATAATVIIREMQTVQSAMARKADPRPLAKFDFNAAKARLGLGREVDALLAAHKEATQIAKAARPVKPPVRPPVKPPALPPGVREGWLTYLGAGLSHTGASYRLVLDRDVVALVKSDAVDFTSLVGMRVRVAGKRVGTARLTSGEARADVIDVARVQILFR